MPEKDKDKKKYYPQFVMVPSSKPKGGEFEQVQADWAQTDSSKVDYIKNKPVIPSGSGADWNAQAGEDGYIENKPFDDVVRALVIDGDSFELNSEAMIYKAEYESELFVASDIGKTIYVEALGRTHEATIVESSGALYAIYNYDVSQSEVVDPTDDAFMFAAADDATTALVYDKNQGTAESIEVTAYFEDVTKLSGSKIKVDGETVTVNEDGELVASASSQVQADWNESDSTAPDYIKNKPSIPAETPIATTSVAGKVKPDGTTITVDSNGEIKAPYTSIDITNRFNTIFGDNTPPVQPEYPPVKTNYVLPSSNLPMVSGYDIVFPIFTVDTNGHPYYYEVYFDVPAGVIIHGICFARDWSDSFALIVSNTNSSNVNIDHIYFDKYNATTGNKEITKGSLSSLNGQSTIDANASQLCLGIYDKGQFRLYNTEYYLNVNNIPLITTGTYRNTTQWTGQTTAVPINNNWIYTINAGSTDSTPWQTLLDKVSAIECTETVDGTYQLQATVTDGVVAYEWVPTT